MPATVEDIAAATREVAVATWTDAAIAARYPGARDGSAQPAEGFFDSQADADAVMAARGALIGTERRRFAVDAKGQHWPDLSVGLLQARLIDGEQHADLTCLAARIEIDLETETTSLELFG